MLLMVIVVPFQDLLGNHVLVLVFLFQQRVVDRDGSNDKGVGCRIQPLSDLKQPSSEGLIGVRRGRGWVYRLWKFDTVKSDCSRES